MLTCILMVCCCVIRREFSRGGLISYVYCNFHPFLSGYTAFFRGRKRERCHRFRDGLMCTGLYLAAIEGIEGASPGVSPGTRFAGRPGGTPPVPRPLRSCCRARYSSPARAGREDGRAAAAAPAQRDSVTPGDPFGHPWRPSASLFAGLWENPRCWRGGP